LVSGSSQIDVTQTQKYSTLATTGSNTFFGLQTFSGSVYIANDLIVQGSSSIQYISASSVSIGTNIVQLNTANPSVRYAGLSIIDSGSIGGSGSFLYDSVQDEFIFVHRGNGTNVTSSHFVTGPETYDNLGNETYLTNNRLPKGTGKEHLNDSNITDTGTLITLGSNTSVTGIVTATGFSGSLASTNGVVSGSSQITYASISSIPAGIVSGSSQTINYLNSAAPGVVSGSTQTILNLPTGTVSGSSQITISSTTGYGSVLNQAVLTSSSPTFVNLTATGTITETSSLRYKENVETIKYGLDKVLQMRGVTYNKKDNGVKELGVIAEEIYEVLPEVVLKNEQGEIDSVSYSRITAVLIEAIKDLKKEIEDLKVNR
jgi:hypothetical protein